MTVEVPAGGAEGSESGIIVQKAEAFEGEIDCRVE